VISMTHESYYWISTFLTNLISFISGASVGYWICLRYGFVKIGLVRGITSCWRCGVRLNRWNRSRFKLSSDLTNGEKLLICTECCLTLEEWVNHVGTSSIAISLTKEG
jgi:hypothetical protein